MGTLQVDLLKNSAGDGPPALEKAKLVNASWHISIGVPTINGSFNVSSATDVAAGRATVNFTNSFSDGNYAIGVSPAGAIVPSTALQAAGNVEVRTYSSAFALTDNTHRGVVSGELA